MNEFMFATGIECSYPTIDCGRQRMDQLEATGHYLNWRRDLELVRELGLTYLRYGPPLHKIFLGPGVYDWDFFDEVSHEMQKLGIVPIIDLCHFGLPDWLENFQNPEVPQALADYAAAFARRYPWVKFYTPINEMFVTTKMSALFGVWNECLRSESAFVTATATTAKASILMMRAIEESRPDAVFVHSESSEFYQACCPDPEIRHIADFENQRRFIALDLLYHIPVRADVYAYLLDNGMSRRDYEWFMAQNVTRRSVIGIDYYRWNEKLINRLGEQESVGELFGWYVVASQYFERYKRPLMHTETNCPDADDGPAWLWRQWHNVQLIRQNGVPVLGFTWYSLQDQIDWGHGLSEARGILYPVGLYDLDRNPRPTAAAYRELVSMFRNERLFPSSDLWAVR